MVVDEGIESPVRSERVMRQRRGDAQTALDAPTTDVAAIVARQPRVAHAGGGFLFLATHAVIGEILKHHKTIVLVNFIAGFSVIGSLILLFHLKG